MLIDLDPVAPKDPVPPIDPLTPTLPETPTEPEVNEELPIATGLLATMYPEFTTLGFDDLPVLLPRVKMDFPLPSNSWKSYLP